MVILSLAVSRSSKLGLATAISRSRLGLGLALGVFLRIEYNRNSRFNFVGNGIPLIGICPSGFYSDSSTGTFGSLEVSVVKMFYVGVGVGKRSSVEESTIFQRSLAAVIDMIDKYPAGVVLAGCCFSF